MIKWLTYHEGWKVVLALVYATICIFDFIIVPGWIGLTRLSIDEMFAVIHTTKNLDVSVQHTIVEFLTYKHEPFTLGFGGMFHIAFGALLTGSALNKRRREDNT